MSELLYRFPFAGLFGSFRQGCWQVWLSEKCGYFFLSQALWRANGAQSVLFLVTWYNLPGNPLHPGDLHVPVCHRDHVIPLLKTRSQGPTAPGIKSRFPTMAFDTLHEPAQVWTSCSRSVPGCWLCPSHLSACLLLKHIWKSLMWGPSVLFCYSVPLICNAFYSRITLL